MRADLPCFAGLRDGIQPVRLDGSPRNEVIQPAFGVAQPPGCGGEVIRVTGRDGQQPGFVHVGEARRWARGEGMTRMLFTSPEARVVDPPLVFVATGVSLSLAAERNLSAPPRTHPTQWQ